MTRTSLDAGIRAALRKRRGKAERLLRKALDEAETPADVVDARRWLGLVAYWHGSYDEADAHFAQALAVAERDDDTAGLLSDRGRVANAREQWEDAEQYYRQALTHTDDRASHLLDLGWTAARAGRHDQADDLFREVTDVSEEAGDRPRVVLGFWSRGDLAIERGDLEGAEEWHRTAVRLSETLDDPALHADCLERLAETLGRRKRAPEAMALLVHAVLLAGRSSRSGWLWYRLSRLAAESGAGSLDVAWREATGRRPPLTARLRLTAEHVKFWWPPTWLGG